MVKPTYDWQKWDELAVRVRGLANTETTYTVWKNFRSHGTITFIELFETRNGPQELHAKIRFSPAPTEAFWASGKYTMRDDKFWYIANISLSDNRRQGLRIQSPIRRHIFYDPKMKLSATTLHFGLMINPHSMMPMHSVTPIQEDLTFVVDLLHNRVVVSFNVRFQDPRSSGATDYASNSRVAEYNRVNRYMFQIPFGQLQKIQRMNLNPHVFALVITLDSPPQYFRKRVDETAGHAQGSQIWSEFDTWYRQTDIVYDPYRLQTAKVTLHKERPAIDIGRWTTYLFEFPRRSNSDGLYDNMKRALQDFNIEIVHIPTFTKVLPKAAGLWSLINVGNSTPAGELQHLESNEPAMSLPFEVRYQLEVCISREIINEHNITELFVKKLAEIAAKDCTKARHILEYVASQENRIYDPMSIFEDIEALGFSSKTEIPHYCAYSRKATITPSTIYFSSPAVETTNRVLRHYARENRDGRFLRVQFTDELFEGRINACAEKQRNDELFTRVYRTLFNGIQIGDRHYEFLAFGNSQFRENGAYFFCPTDHLSCDDIRHWMGNFSDIKVVAKYAARLGQCFSTTRAINGLSKPDIVKIPDVFLGKNKEYCSTDGVGKISPFLAQMIAAELGIRSATAPSAFQFRLGGCKGILTVWPEAKDKEVHIRKSQQKFTATYNGLEIIRCSRFSCATLNRQTITILSSLGVEDEVFLKMLTEQLENYQSAMSNDDLAVSLLLRYIDDNQMTINIATMIRNGFMAERDPFVMSLLHLWRAWSIKLLKEKAKIIIENGAFVLGCVDETGTLRGYTKPTVAPGEQLTKEDLPQIFLQVPDKIDPNRYNVIQGICLVGRNPSLHPGDLRVVEAVDIEALHHLRDVVVFPLKGERDVPSMCSGGDLDGDDFFVIWDKDLRPPEWNCEPMNYSAPPPKEHNRPVEVADLMKFFVRFMKNDSLPTIAHAHLAQSDFLDGSVKDSRCLELAALHSKAVDYVKTGEPAQMPKRLRPNKWPHFMEKRHKPKDAQYHSHKILGQLYDKVETVNFKPQYEEPFDKRILRAYALDDSLLKTVRQIKSQYDYAMKRLMNQQEVKTEFEIWSTFVLSKPRVGSDYKLQEEIGRLSDSLKDHWRSVCIEKAGSKDFSVLGPFVAAMYKVTKEELDIALAECRSMKIVGGREVPRRKMEPKFMPLMSFPWLFEKELGRIATGIDASDDLEDPGLAHLTLGEANYTRKRQGGGLIDIEDYIQQEDGIIVHRGEELDLFRQDVDSEGLSDDGNLDARESHDFTMGDSGELILATEFQLNTPVPEHLRSGTGVEDVVPRTILDGLDPPQEMHTYDSTSLGASHFDNWRRSPSPGFNNAGGSSSAVSDHTPVATPTSSSKAELTGNSVKPKVPEILEEEIVRLNTQQSPLEKLANLMGGSTASEIVNPTEGVKAEVVGVDIKDSSLGKLSKLADEPSSETMSSGEGSEEEEVVHIEMKESALEKLARLTGS
ncbi:RdRP-domain-containing protein [Stipitochalara longipes BDJ]|nr:RdRP-domain-containing protein [Stipitochalara longipes BDJ]